jgi:hypothetical protein
METNRQLVEGDRDNNIDVYERRGGETRLVSTGPLEDDAGEDASFDGVSSGGGRVFFETADALVPSDGDAETDVYERRGGQTILLSKRPRGSRWVEFDGISADGRRVFFSAAGLGVLESVGGQVRRIRGHGDYAGASEDGRRVFLGSNRFEHGRRLEEHHLGRTRTIARDATFDVASANGRTVVFTTRQQLDPADRDTCQDVYARTNDVNTLVSTGVNSGRRKFSARFEGSSADGKRIFFSTQQALAPGAEAPSRPGGNPTNLYVREAGTTALVASFRRAYLPLLDGMSSDGRHAFFETAKPLASNDRDRSGDVYDYYGGARRLISTGPNQRNVRHGARLVGSSADGRRAFFVTAARLVPADRDGALDIYQRAGGATKLISTPSSGSRGEQSVLIDQFWAKFGVHPYGFPLLSSADGRRVCFAANSSFSGNDHNPFRDAFEHHRGRTRLASGRQGGWPWQSTPRRLIRLTL